MSRPCRTYFFIYALAVPLLAVAMMVPACVDDQDSSGASATQPGDDEIAHVHTAFDELLSKVVNEEGLVHYRLLREEENVTQLSSIVNGYAEATLPDNREHRLAFWCNAYNANVLSMIVRAQQSSRPELASVNEIVGFFDKFYITVAGEELTLNALENEKIRPLGDPRIHAALVCAAVACPPLRNEAYRAAKLDEQFDDQSRRWVNDPARFRVIGDVLYVSHILMWYGDDFTGEPFNGRAEFVRKYAAEGSDIAKLLDGNADPKIAYFAYDWSLNDAEN